jgi:ABC-type branched-subunit amino acid transport system substrate-binding protein
MLLAFVMLASVVVATQVGSAGAQVRGFDGSTIKVASMGNQAQLGSAQVGTEARIQRFNETDELEGIQIEYAGFADDKNDPATALNEARRLVTQEQVFALVGDVSSYHPYDFLAQNKVPFYGWGIDKAYCAPTVVTDLWGFGYNGCQVNPSPEKIVDYGGQWYGLVSEKSGKKRPTMAIIYQDTTTGRDSLKQNLIAYKGSGFKIVYGKATLPSTPVADYTPYAQELLTSDGGEAPDMIRCASGTECLNIYGIATSGGYEGVFNHSLYTDILVKPFAGSFAGQSNASISETDIPSLNRMKEDVEAFKPGQKIDSQLTAGYASTDMFIQALKKAAKGGKSKITPENVQKANSKMTWEMKGFTGPTIYPVATNRQDPYCVGIAESDGTVWNTVVERSCSKKTFQPPKG